MDRDETHAALRMLHAVAMADGTISPEEELTLRLAGEAFGGDAHHAGKIDVAAEAARLESEGARIAVFEAAVALAAVDGRVSPEEHALLEQLRAALRLEQPLPVVAREERWAERMRGPRQAMRSAEIEFLHAIAARRDGISDDEYRPLLEELRRAQAEALRDELDPAFAGRATYVPER